MTLVSVGLPVRNGAATLQLAVESIRRQTHAELEIVLSDNASSDGTERLCREYAEAEPRIRVLRHEHPIPAIRNFRAAFEAASGPFFLWAAHDDWRSENYVATLLAALQSRPQASLAFSDVILFRDFAFADKLLPLAFDFETGGLPLLARLKKTTQTAPFHVYGLIRREALMGYPWYETEYAPDWPVMAWLACRGEFLRAPGAQLLYHWPAKGKSEQDKATANTFRSVGRLARERMAWICSEAVLRSGAPEARSFSRLGLAVRLYVWQRRGLKNLLFTSSPRALQRAWRLLKPARSGEDGEP